MKKSVLFGFIFAVARIQLKQFFVEISDKNQIIELLYLLCCLKYLLKQKEIF